MTLFPATLPASIPSPSQGSWDLGFFELRAYALCIMAGIVLAIWMGSKRWLARGGEPGVVADVAVWAVPFGIVGGRLYHVITDNQLYFGEGRDPWRALQIWHGGLGIWGAIALGGVGVWIGCRRRGVPLPAMADALAPGILLAQAVGRWGNWFNQELFGRPTDLPWGLEIDPARRPLGYEDVATFHPTFLYESLWCVLMAVVVIWADKRFRMGHGRVFALYVAGYTLGRAFWESLRIDPANEIYDVRINLWVSALVFVGAILYIVVSARARPGREEPEDLRGFYEDQDPFADAAADAADRGEEEAVFSLPGTGDDDPAEEDSGKPTESRDGAPERRDAAPGEEDSGAPGEENSSAPGEEDSGAPGERRDRAPSEKSGSELGRERGGEPSERRGR